MKDEAKEQYRRRQSCHMLQLLVRGAKHTASSLQRLATTREIDYSIDYSNAQAMLERLHAPVVPTKTNFRVCAN